MARGDGSYHREDLRSELLAAARQFVSDHGHEGLSVRKLAQIVGVSAGAPYHHFPDRRSLLLAVALEGYDEMNALGKRASDTAVPGRDQLFAMSHSFLVFAARHSRLFELMYESELTRPKVDPMIGIAQRKGFEILHEGVVTTLGADTQADVGVRVATLWSTIYGFALLRDRHMMAPHDEISEPRSERTADAIIWHAISNI
ncbi:TetR/AcrR family transcriptional regulator [Sphingomonas populi]|uniref:TetR/AcrR family transcriptional regulator n=1 Tax=Sphingomonas populi TaxID=2484750 RepID=A0A4Q6XNF8_9SPHN|nr:TetR/AcrR family transcriptional regulator [Sphingomonas populi]RZF61155.1 TetR/AcrR family transcriptional regulator [Sphingomonas populi]